jgi:hypothetical protein
MTRDELLQAFHVWEKQRAALCRAEEVAFPGVPGDPALWAASDDAAGELLRMFASYVEDEASGTDEPNVASVSTVAA